MEAQPVNSNLFIGSDLCKQNSHQIFVKNKQFVIDFSDKQHHAAMNYGKINCPYLA